MIYYHSLNNYYYVIKRGDYLRFINIKKEENGKYVILRIGKDQYGKEYFCSSVRVAR